MEVLLQGLALVMTGKVLLLMTVGVIFGIVFGAIPWLAATSGPWTADYLWNDGN